MDGGSADVGPRVLIADHEPDLVATYVRLLSARGYACVTAHTGQHAIELIDQHPPNVVVTALHLPDVDGLTVIRRARAHDPFIPSVLMTAYHRSPLLSRASETGATIVLAKPFANRALLEAIERSLHHR